MGGTHAARDRRGARAALPRGRGVGEAAPDLRGAAVAHDRRRTSARACCAAWPRSPSRSWSIRSRRFGWWAQAVSEDPASEQALDELLRLARATHQWDAYVTTMSGRGVADRAASGRGATCCCAWPRRFENDLGDLERAEQALVQVLGEHDRDSAALASLDRIYESAGDVREPGGDPAPAHRRSPTTPTSWSRCTCASGASYAEALEDDRSRPSRSYLAVLEHESRSREALEALERLYFRSERWPELYGVYEKLVDIARATTTAMADCYARMAKLAADALGQRERPSSCGAASLDMPRRRSRRRWPAWPTCTRRRSEWKELTEVLEKQVGGHAAIPRPRSRSTSAWGASGARSCRASATRSRAGRRCWSSIRRTSTPCGPSPPTTRSAGAWEELSQALRRLIQVGPAGRQRHRARRAEGAVRAARRARGRDPDAHAGLDRRLARGAGARRARLPRAGGPREAVHAGGALGGGASTSSSGARAALASPTEQVDVLMQAASLWADKIGDGGSAAEVYERVLQIDPGQPDWRRSSSEQLYRQRKSWVKLVDLLLARTEFAPDARGAHLRCSYQVARDLRAAARRSRQRVRDAAGGVPRGLLQRPRRQGAGAAGDGGRQVERADRRLHAGRCRGSRDPKQAADLWVKIARWYDSALRHVDYAIASAQQALQLGRRAHRRAAGAGGLLPQAEALERSGGGARPPRRGASRSRGRASTSCCSSPTPTRRRSATPRRRWPPTSARWTPTSAASTPSTRSSACTAARRPGTAWSTCWPRSRRWSTTPTQAIRLKLQVGELWEDRLGDNDRAVDAYKEVLSVDPQNLPALKALDTLYEKTGRMEEYLENLEHRLEVVAARGGPASAIYQQMATIWEENFAKPDRAAEVLEKILLIDDRNAEGVPRSRAPLPPGAQVGVAGRHLPQAHPGHQRHNRAHRPLFSKMGQVYEQELRDLDRAIDSYSDVLNVEDDHADALAGPCARLYEETEQWDRAVEIDAAADPRQHRSAPEGRPQLSPGQDLRRADEGSDRSINIHAGFSAMRTFNTYFSFIFYRRKNSGS